MVLGEKGGGVVSRFVPIQGRFFPVRGQQTEKEGMIIDISKGRIS